MDLPQETEDYIRESIEYSLGLPVSSQTLQSKLRTYEELNVRLQNKYLSVLAKLKEKDEKSELHKAEMSMSASALKKFVEENQRLALECSNLLAESKRLEKECLLYEADREALMDFGNEQEERAKEAEIRVHDLEECMHKQSEELHFYKSLYEAQLKDETDTDDVCLNQNVLDSILETVIRRDDYAPSALAFLELNSDLEAFQGALKKWKRLKPSTQKVIALVSDFTILRERRELSALNHHRADQEVMVLSEERNMLEESNKSLLLRLRKKRNTPAGSTGKYSSSKGSKRKPSPTKETSPVGKLDFSVVDSPRKPLSPLRENSPEYRSPKK